MIVAQWMPGGLVHMQERIGGVQEAADVKRPGNTLEGCFSLCSIPQVHIIARERREIPALDLCGLALVLEKPTPCVVRDLYHRASVLAHCAQKAGLLVEEQLANGELDGRAAADRLQD
jgi:hypothetical protein